MTVLLSSKSKRVSFQEEKEHATYQYVCANRELSKDLFYQPEDYSRFRAQFRQERRQKAQLEQRIRLVKKQTGDTSLLLSLGLQQEMWKLQMVKNGTTYNNNIPKVPRPTVFRSALQSRKGCARMA